MDALDRAHASFDNINRSRYLATTGPIESKGRTANSRANLAFSEGKHLLGPFPGLKSVMTLSTLVCLLGCS